MSNVVLNDVQVERGEGGLVTLQVQVSPDSVRTMREQIIRDYGRQLRVPGFRPGHVPVNIVRRNVGDEAIAQRVSDELVPVAYQQALQQTELQPLERAQVDELTFDAFNGEEPLQFTARVVVRPDIPLSEYKGLPVEMPQVEVTDADVEEGIETLRSERATMRDIEGRGAQEGDVLSADLGVYIGGEMRGDEPTKLRAFVLGESGFVPRIDEHLLGAMLDEERRFPITYPSDFNDPELAGQVAEFAVKITSLKERILPELNDEFAQTLGAADLSELRLKMREFIREGRERETRDAARADIARRVTEATPFETPTSVVETRVENRMHNLQHELEHRQATLEQYLLDTGQTDEEFRANLRQEAESEVRQELVLDEIARREELSVAPEEIETHYLRMAQVLRQPVEQLVQNVDVNSVRASILQRKAVDLLMDSAQISGQTAPAEPALIVTPQSPTLESAPVADAADEPRIIVPGQS